MIPLKDENPTGSFPIVTVLIIAINAAVFLFQSTLTPGAQEVFIYRTAVIPYEITHFTDIYPWGILPPPFTLLTAMFVHGGFFHMAGNMLYLWIFGDNIEDRLGHLRFLLFYLFTGAVASLAHIMAEPSSSMPMVGASGAVAGVLGAYFLVFPRARILTLLFFFFFVQVVRVPALVFLGIWFVFQVLNSMAGGNIAWFAHIGGFLAGMLLIGFTGRGRAR
ncbi:MAG TPA: rhomboid family intramembrane serine protease [Deltaproteobacteria bacterium]|nr:rhomboid family intramembrane serine protease [Deltaproteobacteria bacterium]